MSLADTRQEIIDELMRLPREAETAERRIKLGRDVLALVDRDLWPAAWAEFHLNLGFALIDRGRLVPDWDPDEALVEYRAAATVFDRHDYPKEWMQTQLAMGNAYMFSAYRKDTGHTERAIECYEAALMEATPDEDAEMWATLHGNLGEAYRLRPFGDQAANIEESLEQSALAVNAWREEGDRGNEAIVRLTFGSALVWRRLGDRDINLGFAQEHLRKVLELITRDASPEVWAKAHLNLAVTYLETIDPWDTERLVNASKHLEKSLEILSKQAQPREWGIAHMGLGLVYDDKGDSAKAFEHFETALEALSPEHFGEDWALTQFNLAEIYRERTDGNPAENFARAERHYLAALSVYRRETHPVKCRKTLRLLGALYFDQRLWEKAYSHLAEAIVISDDLWETTFTHAGREAELAETTRLYSRATYCLLQLGEPSQALQRLEHGKMRLLTGKLALGNAEPAILASEQGQELRIAWRTVQRVENELRDPGVRAAILCRELNQARVDITRCIDRIRIEHPDFMSTSIELADILQVAPAGGALVYPLFTSQGSAAFVLPHGLSEVSEGHVLHLEDFTDQDLMKLLGDWINGLFRWANGGPVEDWQESIETTTSRLWEFLMGPVDAQLKKLDLAEGSDVTLVPQGGLTLLPLHAAWRAAQEKQRYFLDDYTVAYAPSAFSLAVSRKRKGTRADRGLLAVIDPEDNLPFAITEATSIATAFPDNRIQIFPRAKASRDAILRQDYSECAYLHFACHAFYHWSNVDQSALQLADGKLTLNEIVSSDIDLGAVRLVTLSACESGQAQIFRPVSKNIVTMGGDEYIGLPSGFLQAGAPAVVSALWSVSDYSTSLLMGEFYRRHRTAKQSISRALRGAQLWLRTLQRDEVSNRVRVERDKVQERMKDGEVFDSDRKLLQELAELLEELSEYEKHKCPFEHPDYWAPFTATGAV